MATPYPLEWPKSWARTPDHRQKRSRFRDSRFGKIRDTLLAELRRLGSTRIVISTEIPLRLDGLPRANATEGSHDDPGAAVYFQWKGKPLVIACDTYYRTWENVRAISETVKAMRAIDRHGASQILERAVSGFAELPAGEEEGPPPDPWWTVLGIPTMNGVDFIEVGSDAKHPMRKPLLHMAEAMFKARVPEAHPDRGGSQEAMAELNRAIRDARSALGKGV